MPGAAADGPRMPGKALDARFSEGRLAGGGSRSPQGQETRVARKRHGFDPLGVLGVGLTLLVVGCSSHSAGSPAGEYGSATSEMAVRGFLDGAGAKDYGRMMKLFGTSSGPAVDRFGVTDVEQRMIVLAGILQHASYDLRQANLAQLGPDRVRWEVTLEGTRKGTVVVPVITTPDSSGRWFVERLNLDALTASVGS